MQFVSYDSFVLFYWNDMKEMIYLPANLKGVVYN